MNPDLAALQPYPFERLNQLKSGVTPPAHLKPINLSIGEPQHATPEFIISALRDHLNGLARYPTTRGEPALREAIGAWLARRFDLPRASLDIENHILPVNGTREALFAVAQCLIDRRSAPLVLMPNPFYQIYEGAALLSGATPWFLNTTARNGFLPDFAAVPDTVWQRCQLIYICSPGNPCGAVLDIEALQQLIRLADQYDFVIASDECYSELYLDEGNPAPGLLQAAARMGRDDYRRCLVFHSLSKRSSVPGLRSGFVAGDAELIRQFHLYRTYHGSAMPPATQMASLAAWKDERHVQDNRRLYREKFDAVLEILKPVSSVVRPAGGFYLWLQTPQDDQTFVRELYARYNVTLLPGSYLSRSAHGGNPGEGYVRIALVPGLDECIEAAKRLREFILTFKEQHEKLAEHY
ncbi:MAG: succinyldiaminopimelate transaminase [Gammaproteobacteria bacterium]|nr:succinyldiaminopimelate transaminase [Gammaproteobacteria bacterium]